MVQILLQLLPAALLVSAFSGIGAMHVMSRVQVVDSGYRLSQLEQESRALLLENDRLKLELATLKNPARLERAAREQLGMGAPPPGAVLTFTPARRSVTLAERAH
jgi:cell division protein FtsL